MNQWRINMSYWRKFTFNHREEAEKFARCFNAEVQRMFDEEKGQTIFFVAW